MKMEIERIQKSYRKKQVLKNISFRAAEGDCIGILGSNGSGKSTLLSILAGVQQADQGAFLVNGNNLLDDPVCRSKTVGYVPQGTPFMEELTAWDNLRLFYRRADLKRELENGVLSLLGIPEFVNVRVGKLSGGMKKRLSIGCAMAAHPQILLLDEACAALDLVCKGQILDYFEHYKKNGGCLILATHDVQEIERCSQCYILKDGILMPYQYDGHVQSLVEKL